MTMTSSTQHSLQDPPAIPVSNPSLAGSPSAEEDTPARLRASIGKLSRRLRHTAAGAGLTPTEISVLITVSRRGPLRLAELAEIEAINPTMLSRIAGRLTEMGLIDRTADPGDRRAVVVQSTAAGRKMHKRIHAERTKALAKPIAALGAGEREALEAALPVLDRLAEQLSERAR